MLKLSFILMFLVSSCASFSGEWSDWRTVSVPSNEKAWHFCREELHGPELNEKGMCYVDQECRYRRTIFGKKKSECRNKNLFCKWGDIQCMRKYNIFFNKIINEGVLR